MILILACRLVFPFVFGSCDFVDRRVFLDKQNDPRKSHELNTNADDAERVVYGFTPGVVSFGDGSADRRLTLDFHLT